MKRSILMYSASSDRGERQTNQDNLRISKIVPYANMTRHFSMSGALETDTLHIFCVCDGIGGAVMGDLAAMHALDGIHEYLSHTETNNGDITHLLLEAAEASQKRVTALFRRNRSLGGCTLTMLGIRSGMYAFLNIGDSSGFLSSSEGTFMELSQRHHLAWCKETLGMEPEQADYHRLIHYIGKEGCHAADMAHCIAGTLQAGDRLLLCSDGITDSIPYEMIHLRLRSDDSAEDFVAAASKAENADNSTAICLSIL